MPEKIKLFLSNHCQPCLDARAIIASGKVTVDGVESRVEVVDADSEEGLKEAILNNLDRVPSAVTSTGKHCRIDIDREKNTLIVECEND